MKIKIILLSFIMVISSWISNPITEAQTAMTAPSQPQPKVALIRGQPAGRPLASLSKILKPDGSINLKTGFSGSLDPSGFQMSEEPDRRPRFVRMTFLSNSFGSIQPNIPALAAPALAGDEYWDKRLVNGVTDPGVAVYVYAVVVMGSDVYVGGTFSRAGGIAANNIARWSNATHQWYPLGGGINGTIYALAASGSAIYAGGSFNDVAGQPAWSLARWDTAAQSWSVIGGFPGVQSGGKFVGTIHAMAVDSGKVYVGGYFDHAGAILANNIAVWDGSAWSALSGGLGGTNDTVMAMAVSGNDVYAGGIFSTPFNNIAHWNGSVWTSLGGTDGPVLSLALNGTNLYAGGGFSQAGLTQAAHIGMWNGSSWAALGSGMDGDVTTLALAAGGLYAGGNFLHAGGFNANHFSLWNGSTWSYLGTGADGEVLGLAVTGSDVYVGGSYHTLDNRISNNISRWSAADSTSYSLGNSLDGNVNAIAVSGNDVYIGGDFNSAGGVPVHSIAHWNSLTDTWSAMGSTLIVGACNACYQIIYTIAINGNNVYAGGQLYENGVFNATLGRWNPATNTWASVYFNGCSGQNCTPKVSALASEGSGVVVGGIFREAGCTGCIMNNVFYWDGGTTFSPFTDGNADGTDGPVYALAYDGGGTWIGGDFTSPGAYLSYFDGSNFYSTGSPLNAYVDAIALSANTLYVGGSFSNAGNSGANLIAQLAITPGSDWQPVGGNPNGVVTALVVDGTDLLAAGFFTQIGLTGVNYIARWNTVSNTWSPVGSGLGYYAVALALGFNTIFTGGVFETAGGIPSDFLARWALTRPVYLPLIIK